MTRIEENGKLFETNFGELGLKVKFIKGIESPLGETYLYDLVYVSQYNKNYLKSLLEKIAVYHHLDLKIIDSKEAHFGVFVNQRTTNVSLAQCMREDNQRNIVIGKDVNNNLVKIDFNKVYHLLIAGTTGSGKSVLIHNLLVNLMSYYRTTNENNRFRKELNILIIDPKGSELGMYRNLRNALFIDDPNKAIQVLEKVVADMDRRYKENIPSTSDLFIVIDELADLMLRSKYQVEESISRLASKGRALGIHLIVATQTPRVAVISGIIKANIENRIGLKTASKTDSVCILDHAGCEDLQGCGDSIVRLNGIETRCQIAYPENELESAFINNNRG